MASVMIKSKHGKDVVVQYGVSRQENFLHVIEVVGTCGAVTERSKITIGAVDGLRPSPPTKEKLQEMLNEYRQRVADEASWKEIVRENIGGLV